MGVGTNVEVHRIPPCERATQSPARPNNYDPHLVPAAAPFSISAGILQQFLPPSLVLKVPIDRFSNPIPSIAARVPVQLAFSEAGVNGITPVMPEPISDEGNQAVWFAQLIQNEFNHFKVRQFTITAEVIDRTGFSFEEGGYDAGAVITNVNPITHVHSIAVYRERFIAERLYDHKRYQFFGKLIRTVIVRATRNDDVLAEGFETSQRQEVGASLTRRVGRT